MCLWVGGWVGMILLWCVVLCREQCQKNQNFAAAVNFFIIFATLTCFLDIALSSLEEWRCVQACMCVCKDAYVCVVCVAQHLHHLPPVLSTRFSIDLQPYITVFGYPSEYLYIVQMWCTLFVSYLVVYPFFLVSEIHAVVYL